MAGLMQMAHEGRSSSPPSSPAPRRGRRSISPPRARRSISPPRVRRSISPPRARQSVSPVRPRRSVSPPKSRRSRSRSHDSEGAVNPGNNLYVTGLSSRVTERDLEKCFSKEGKVLDCHLVVDPHSKESRGFAFVTMDTTDGAERCIKYLNRSTLEGRLITVEKAKRSRGRTPTPGRYQGLAEIRAKQRRDPRGESPRRRYERGPDHRDRRGRSPSPYRRRSDERSSYRRYDERR